MVRKLILSVITSAIASLAIAQDTKTTQNTPSANIDYKREGSPMPAFYMREYHDTTAANAPELSKKDKKRRAKEAKEIDADRYSTLSAKDLDDGKTLLIMLFNPTCSHCEDMTMRIEQNISMFRKADIVLMASKPMAPYIPDFASRFQIGKYPVMRIGYDSSNFVDKIFAYQQLPQLTIYNSDRKLIKIFTGEVPIDSLKKFIDQ